MVCTVCHFLTLWYVCCHYLPLQSALFDIICHYGLACLPLFDIMVCMFAIIWHYSLHCLTLLAIMIWLFTIIWHYGMHVCHYLTLQSALFDITCHYGLNCLPVCKHFSDTSPGPSCLKLTTTLDNDSLKLTWVIRKYAEIFCWKNVSSFCSAKAAHMFLAKNFRILCIESTKTVNEMTLHKLVKLTTLWTTGPR